MKSLVSGDPKDFKLAMASRRVAFSGNNDDDDTDYGRNAHNISNHR